MTLKLCKGPSALALGLALTVGAIGCGSDQTAGGLTNPNPGSVVDRDKGAVRDDLPVPDLNAGHKEPVAEAAASSPSSTGSAAGTAAEGGGQPGAKADASKGSAKGASSPPASPPVKSNSGEASGGTKPAGPIKEGNPSGPQ